MQLKDICVLDVACCTPDLSIAAAARMMRQQHAGDLIVVDDNDSNREPVGIITDRDIVVEVLAQGLDPDKTSVGETMTTRLVIAAGSEDVYPDPVDRGKVAEVLVDAAVSGKPPVVRIVPETYRVRVRLASASRRRKRVPQSVVFVEDFHMSSTFRGSTVPAQKSKWTYMFVVHVPANRFVA